MLALFRYSRSLRDASRALAANVRNDRGAVATEYAVLIAFGVVVIAVGVLVFGNELSTFFGNLVDGLGGPNWPDAPD